MAKLKVVHLKLDVDLHKKLRIKALMEGVTMQDFLTQLVRQAVGAKRKPRKQ